MPRITVKVPSGYEAITRPIATSVVKDVMAATGIDSKKTRLHVLGEYGYAEQPGTKLGGSEDVSFGGNSRIYVTVDDTLRFQSIHNQYVRANENPPILYDSHLGIGLYPVYVESDLNISFKYIAKSKEEAKKWVEEFCIRRAEERSVLYHEIMYYIPIQDGIFKMFSHFHDLRERIAGYGDTFTEWIKSMQCRELTTQTRLDGDIRTGNVSVPEKQAGLTGIFDFSDVPKEVKTDGGTTWEIEWSYKVLYKRCTHFYLSYPMVIHQSHIASKYFKKKKLYSLEEIPKYQGIVVTAFDLMDGYYESYPQLKGGIRFPDHDDWIPDVNSQPPLTYPLISWLLGLNPKDPTKLLTLTDLPEIRLSKCVDDYIRIVYKDLPYRGRTALHLTLYKDGIPLSDGDITVDKNLEVRSKVPLDLRYMYHLRISAITHKRAFKGDAIKILRQHPCAFKEISKSLHPNVNIGYIDDNLVLGKIIPVDIIEEFYDSINGGKGYVPNTNNNLVEIDSTHNNTYNPSSPSNNNNTYNPSSPSNNTGSGGGNSLGGTKYKTASIRFIQNLAIVVKR